ncbi:polyamine-modulated factor 1-like protein [Lates japonicus]|uniref:Polyamine-modulated factor 1-like protein n=1 Tax=Lates japonicus TaxID=270547 RepID=A0AAD3NGU6_LATJO|nr:polyamine-modulated factor 1-like protein [Lates japonicus]
MCGTAAAPHYPQRSPSQSFRSYRPPGWVARCLVQTGSFSDHHRNAMVMKNYRTIRFQQPFVNLSFNRFASTFRPLYKKNPQRMESIHKQFIEELRKSIQEDISRLTEEGHLEFKLNELDKLERAAKNKPAPAWRPSGVPEQDLCSFLMPYYQKQEAYMRLELKKIQAENAALAQKVQAGRESIAQTENRISAAVDEWKASVTEFETLASSLCPADVFDV